MSATRRTIIARNRAPFSGRCVDPGDFSYQVDGETDPAEVLSNPYLILYAFDHAAREALFVQTPEAADVASASSFSQAQFQHASGVIAVPYETFHQLAERAPSPRTTALILHCGRCGSTLLTKLLRMVDQVVAISTPDVFLQLALLYENGKLDERDLAALLRSAMRLMWRPGLKPDASCLVLKPRTSVLGIAEQLLAHLPASARLLFSYRGAEGSIRSRRGLLASQAVPANLAPIAARIGNLMPKLAPGEVQQVLATRGEVAMDALWWTASLELYLRFREKDPTALAIRYEDLIVAPERALRLLLDRWELPWSDVLPERIRAAMATDAQAGTPLSVAPEKKKLFPAEHQIIREVITQYASFGDPDPSLPGTLS